MSALWISTWKTHNLIWYTWRLGPIFSPLYKSWMSSYTTTTPSFRGRSIRPHQPEMWFPPPRPIFLILLSSGWSSLDWWRKKMFHSHYSFLPWTFHSSTSARDVPIFLILLSSRWSSLDWWRGKCFVLIFNRSSIPHLLYLKSKK